MSTSPASSLPPILLRRVHGETALFVVSLIVGVAIWAGVIALAITAASTAALIGIYVLIIFALYFVARIGFITHVRGNGARLGPEQFPELYARVQTLAARMGLKRVPAAYLMQAGGALNALATKFIGRSMVVLYSDLIEACGDSTAAGDMIIGHELAHVRAGHVRLHWLLFPSLIVPFLSTALSRAREYTCDRMGLEGAGEKEGALLGLSILSVGGTFGRRLGRPALVAQQRDLNTGWMTLGQWFSTHPPLAKRLAVLDPASSTEPHSSAGGTLRALAIILCFFIVVMGGAVFAVKGISSGLGGLLGKSLAGASSYDSSSDSSRDNGYTLPETAQEDLAAAFAQVGAVIDKEMSAGREAPEDYDGLVALWDLKKQDQAIPIDPYDGQELGYAKTATGYQLWSSGPDGHPDTEDDITFDGPQK